MIKETNGHLENERHEPESIQSSTFKPISQKYGVQYVIEILTLRACSHDPGTTHWPGATH